jgi:tryptophan synthase alpha chain
MISPIRKAIELRNHAGQKALSVFLTSGYPDPAGFVDLAVEILSSGADMLELGIPFSDPIADGPVIQVSSQIALKNGVTLRTALDFSEQIKRRTDKPVILMGYANPILQYGLKEFIRDAQNSGCNGVIIPDVPLEEYRTFWPVEKESLDVILLTTPTAPEQRIHDIDNLSEGFVYCVSVTGTTGMRENFSEDVIRTVSRTYDSISKNKMLIGFGISGSDDVKKFSLFCDGVIVGSAVIRHLNAGNPDVQGALDLVASLRVACDKLE